MRFLFENKINISMLLKESEFIFRVEDTNLKIMKIFYAYIFSSICAINK